MTTRASTPAAPLPVRRITTTDMNWALAQGWRDFKDKRGDLIFVAVLYPLIGLLAALFALNDAALPLFFPLVAGLSILGPAVASGFYELARRREEGRDATWRHFLEPLTGPRGTTIALLSVGLMVLFLGWLAVAYAIYATSMGPNYPVGLNNFTGRLFGTADGWTMIMLGNLAGGVFAVIVLVTSIVSFPMAVDRDVDAATALETSVRAVRANPGAIAGWGARVAGLLLLGCLPAFIGLAVVLPVLGYATWHLYTRLVVRG